VEAQLDHAFAIVRKTFGTGIGAGRTTGSQSATASGTVSPAVAQQGEVLVTVARTDAPLEEVMRTIEEALKER
jgi:phosphohistidine swiveling domain-containing protein